MSWWQNSTAPGSRPCSPQRPISSPGLPRAREPWTIFDLFRAVFADSLTLRRTDHPTGSMRDTRNDLTEPRLKPSSNDPLRLASACAQVHAGANCAPIPLARSRGHFMQKRFLAAALPFLLSASADSRTAAGVRLLASGPRQPAPRKALFTRAAFVPTPV